MSGEGIVFLHNDSGWGFVEGSGDKTTARGPEFKSPAMGSRDWGILGAC